MMKTTTSELTHTDIVTFVVVVVVFVFGSVQLPWSLISVENVPFIAGISSIFKKNEEPA